MGYLPVFAISLGWVPDRLVRDSGSEEEGLGRAKLRYIILFVRAPFGTAAAGAVLLNAASASRDTCVIIAADTKRL